MGRLLSSALTKKIAANTLTTVAGNLQDNPNTKSLGALLFSVAILGFAINAIRSYCGDPVWLGQFKDAIIANKWWVIFVFAATAGYVFGIMRPKGSIFSHKFNAIFILLMWLGIFIYPLTPDFGHRFGYITGTTDAEYFAIFLPLWIMCYAICLAPRAKEGELEKSDIKKIKKTLKNPVTKKKSKSFFDLNKLSTRAVVLLTGIGFIFMLTGLWFNFIGVVDDSYVNTYLCIPFGVFGIGMGLMGILYDFEELRKGKFKVTTKDVTVLEENPNKDTTNSIPEKKDGNIIIDNSEVEEENDSDTDTIDDDSFDDEDSSDSSKFSESDSNSSSAGNKNKSFDPTKADIELLKRRYKAYDSNQSLALVPGLLAIMVTAGMYFTTDPDLFNYKDYGIGLACGILLSLIGLGIVFYYQNRRKRLYKQACDNTIYIDYVEIIAFDRYSPLNKYMKKYNDKEYGYVVITSNGNRKYKSEKFSDYDLGIYNPDNLLWKKKEETTTLKVGKKTHHIGDEVRVFIDNKNDNNYYIDL